MSLPYFEMDGLLWFSTRNNYLPSLKLENNSFKNYMIWGIVCRDKLLVTGCLCCVSAD
jgi:hypothetical protein